MQAGTFLNLIGDARQTAAVFPPPERAGGSLFVLAKASSSNPQAEKAAQNMLQAVVDVLLLEEPQQLVPGAVRSGEQALHIAFMKEAFKQASAQVWRSAQMSGMDATASVLAVMIKNGYGYCCSVGDHILFLSETGSLPPVQANKSQFNPDGTPCVLGGQTPVLPEAFSFKFGEDSILVAGAAEFWKETSVRELTASIESTPVFALAESLVEKLLGASAQAVFTVQGDSFISRQAAGQAGQYLAYLRSLDFGEKRSKAQTRLETWAQAVLDPAGFDAVFHSPEPSVSAPAQPAATPEVISTSTKPLHQPVREEAPKPVEMPKVMEGADQSLDLEAKIRLLQTRVEEAETGSRVYKRAALAAMADLFKVWEKFPGEVENLLTRDKLEKMKAWAMKESSR